METRRLIIRKIEKSDLEDLCEYGCDKETGKYMAYWPKTRKEIEQFIADAIESMKSKNLGKYEIVLELKDVKKVIGNVTLKIEDGSAEIGWISNKRYWNQGYMSEGLEEILRYGFRDLNLKKIYATCTNENIGSYRVMEKNHMKKESENEKYVVKDGERVKYIQLLYAISREEYIKSKTQQRVRSDSMDKSV